MNKQHSCTMSVTRSKRLAACRRRRGADTQRQLSNSLLLMLLVQSYAGHIPLYHR